MCCIDAPATVERSTTGAETIFTSRDLVVGQPLDLRVDRTQDGEHVRAQLTQHLRKLATAGAVSANGEGAAANPSPADPLARWRLLSSLGRTDLTLARLAEGHLDAIAILAEAGSTPRPAATYGVWASASGGTGLRCVRGADGWTLSGLMRFCSGAGLLDRALVIARDDDDPSAPIRMFDIDLSQTGVIPVADSWPAVGMDASESYDVGATDVRVAADDEVGAPGFYVQRTGLHLGGIGVAAVWLGGAQALMDRTLDLVGQRQPDPHQLAHIGAVTTALESAAAVLVHLADVLTSAKPDADTGLPVLGWDDLAALALLARSSVEASVDVALTRLPRVVGPVVLCHDPAFAHGLADLTVYVRQHHAERDLARLGAIELDSLVPVTSSQPVAGQPSTSEPRSR